jgi:hypothetical protein
MKEELQSAREAAVVAYCEAGLAVPAVSCKNYGNPKKHQNIRSAVSETNP